MNILMDRGVNEVSVSAQSENCYLRGLASLGPLASSNHANALRFVFAFLCLNLTLGRIAKLEWDAHAKREAVAERKQRTPKPRMDGHKREHRGI